MISKRLPAEVSANLDVLPWPAGPNPAAARPPVFTAPAPRSAGEPGGANAQELMERRAEEAFEAGLREGAAAARAEAERKVKDSLDQVVKVLAELGEVRSRVLRRAEADVVRLALEIARRVLHRELNVDPSALEGVVKAAVAKLDDRGAQRVRVCPEQAEVVRASLARHAGSRPIEVLPDSGLQPGAVVFEVDGGKLDASIETQLAEIERGLVDKSPDR